MARTIPLRVLTIPSSIPSPPDNSAAASDAGTTPLTPTIPKCVPASVASTSRILGFFTVPSSRSTSGRAFSSPCSTASRNNRSASALSAGTPCPDK